MTQEQNEQLDSWKKPPLKPEDWEYALALYMRAISLGKLEYEATALLSEKWPVLTLKDLDLIQKTALERFRGKAMFDAHLHLGKAMVAIEAITEKAVGLNQLAVAVRSIELKMRIMGLYDPRAEERFSEFTGDFIGQMVDVVKAHFADDEDEARKFLAQINKRARKVQGEAKR